MNLPIQLLIPLFPLLAFLVLGLFGRKYIRNFSGILGTIMMAVSTLISLSTAYGYFFKYGKVDGVFQAIIPFETTWLKFSDLLSIKMGILLDPISVMMIVVVSFVSLMVHIYSLGYMKGEERYPTYYSFLSLFTFSMLGLVLSTNIFETYMFWELVGVSSYLLIGYYFDRPSAVAASKKAFIVTRFADLGFLIGILLLSYYSGSLEFNTLTENLTTPTSFQHSAITASFMGFSALTWALSLVFIGGAGKSAMFPLHIWLPDAMEGPTPVSALIHAATMVVAGVYLVARLFPVYAIACPGVLQVIAYVGAISALLAAVVACTQTDIKRVLAYSTMSQIGFMMFSLGVSGYGGESGLGYMASMFHLFTHAMFKALLFLGAGAVIHFVHSNELKDMGGLRKYLPITHITFLVACLAISGVPPFAGFFSKEEILTAAYHSNFPIYIIAIITAGLTAFYMFRLYFSIFWNKVNISNHDHHSEGPLSMLTPLIILGILSVFAGFVPMEKFVTSDGVEIETVTNIIFSILPVGLSVMGIMIALKMYKSSSSLPEQISTTLTGLYRLSKQKFYIDEIYTFITKKIIFNLIGRPIAWIDRNIVDGFMNLLGAVTQVFSISISGVQSGKLQHYAAYFLAGTIGLTLLFIYLMSH